MRRLVALLLTLALLGTACASGASDNNSASADGTSSSSSTDSTQRASESDDATTTSTGTAGEAETDSTNDATSVDVDTSDDGAEDSAAEGDNDEKLPADLPEIGESPDELAFTSTGWTTTGGTSTASPASSSTPTSGTAKVYTLSGGLSGTDQRGSVTFANGERGDNYCLDYNEATPHYDQDRNLHRVVSGTNTTEGFSSSQIATIETIMDAYNDPFYWNGSTLNSSLPDGIAKAVWSVTNGHSVSGTIARDIMAKVQSGQYERNPDAIWLRSDNTRIQDQIAVIPRPPSQPAPTATPQPSGGNCQVSLFDFPNGNTELTKLGPGSYNFSGNLGWLNDDVESVYVPAGMTITVSEHYDGQGWTKTRVGPGTFDVHDDEISWIKIEGSCEPTPPAPTPVPPTPVPPTPVPPTPVPPTPVPPTPAPEPLGSIGDYIWLDENRDCVQGRSEEPISGVIVDLLDANGNVIDTDTTDSDGRYLFENLPAGNYDIQVRDQNPALDGYEPVCDIDGETDEISDEALSTGENNRDHDFGYYLPAPEPTPVPPTPVPPTPIPPTPVPPTPIPPTPTPEPLASIGDYVWVDENRDCVQNRGEDPIEGVTVNLLDADGNVVDTTTTDADGLYLFEDLPADDYQVEIDGTSSALDDYEPICDKDGETDEISEETLSAGEDNRDHDFGYAPLLASIGDYVWIDADEDCVQDSDEDPISGVTVKLLDANGTVVDTTTTDADGLYLFDNLVPADYTVEIDGSNGALDDYDPVCDKDGETDETSDETLSPGEDNRDHDFGYTPRLGSIGDYIWLDVNRDCNQDADEFKFADIPVSLLDASGAVLDTTTTDSDGLYLFEDLPAGDYNVVVDTSGVLNAYVHLCDPDGGLDSESTYTLTAGENNRTQDFGYAIFGD